MSFLNNSTKSSIVITGGASGIGLSVAKRLVALGHEVIVGGRRAAQLAIAKSEVPGLKTIEVDVSTEAGRIDFHKQILKEYPQVNVLINNAGIANKVSALKDSTDADWNEYKSELAINLEAPIHLAILFLPHLQTKEHSLIANVTSILAFFPLVKGPVYCATKAALHSFTVSLRHQLKDTSVEVFEIIPPAVKTAMNSMSTAMDVEVYAEDVVAQLVEGKNVEIGYQSEHIIRGSRDGLDALVEALAGVEL